MKTLNMKATLCSNPLKKGIEKEGLLVPAPFSH
jgi:hypothetical protein